MQAYQKDTEANQKELLTAKYGAQKQLQWQN